MNVLKPNYQRSQNAINATYFYAAIVAIQIALYAFDLYFYYCYGQGFDSLKTIKTINRIIFVFYYISFLFSIISYIVGVLWFRRAYYNAHQLDPATMRYKDGWTVWAGFIPIINFIIPYQIMQDIWRSIVRILHLQKEINYPAVLINAWWLCYTFYAIFTYTGSYLPGKFFHSSLQRIETRFVLYIIAHILQIMSLFASVVIIKKYIAAEIEIDELLEQPNDSIFSINTTVYQQSYDSTGNS